MECADITVSTFATWQNRIVLISKFFSHTGTRSLIYFKFCEYLLWAQEIELNSLVVSSKRIQRYERKLNIYWGKQNLARTRSSKISRW